jgi:type II secretion system protein N
MTFSMQNTTIELFTGKTHCTEQLESFILTPSPLGWLKGRFPVSFKGRLGGGPFEGTASIHMGGKQKEGDITIQFRKIPLDQLDILHGFVNRDLRGTLEGQMIMSGPFQDVTKLQGEAGLLIQNGIIEAELGLPGLDEIPFERIRLEVMVNNGALKVKEAALEGPVFQGSCFGEILLNRSFGKSRLYLGATLKPGRQLEGNTAVSALLSKIMKQDGTIPVAIKGTLQSPHISLNKN